MVGAEYNGWVAARGDVFGETGANCRHADPSFAFNRIYVIEYGQWQRERKCLERAGGRKGVCAIECGE